MKTKEELTAKLKQDIIDAEKDIITITLNIKH